MILRIARFIKNTLGDDFGGSPSAPGTNCTLRFGDIDPDSGKHPYAATTHNNHGSELWLFWCGSWAAHYSTKDALRLAWFILWDWWAVSTWFGLKRWIWHKALSAIVDSYKVL